MATLMEKTWIASHGHKTGCEAQMYRIPPCMRKKEVYGDKGDARDPQGKPNAANTRPTNKPFL